VKADGDDGDDGATAVDVAADEVQTASLCPARIEAPRRSHRPT